MPVFVLIHSPLAGPATWGPVAKELTRRDVTAVTPTLSHRALPGRAYWQQHVSDVKRSLDVIPMGLPVILVAHSGAGVLLPVIREEIKHRVSGYIFVDALLPEDGKSRLDLFESEQAAAEFRQNAVDGKITPWTDEDLKSVIPDPTLRGRVLDELKPIPLAIYEEKIQASAAWPDAPCGYIRFGQNQSYEKAASQAVGKGWPYEQMNGEHFHMLVDPKKITDILLRMAAQFKEKRHG
jgi:hypothetical protein